VVEAPIALARAVTPVGLAVTAKSLTITVTVVEWVRDPLVPVTVTWALFPVAIPIVGGEIDTV